MLHMSSTRGISHKNTWWLVACCNMSTRVSTQTGSPWECTLLVTIQWPWSSNTVDAHFNIWYRHFCIDHPLLCLTVLCYDTVCGYVTNRNEFIDIGFQWGIIKNITWFLNVIWGFENASQITCLTEKTKRKHVYILISYNTRVSIN